MKNKVLAVLLTLSCAGVCAQDLVGTPLNAPFSSLLHWAEPSTPNKMSMADWVRHELVRHAKPEHKQFADSVKVRLLGIEPGTPCNSMKNFAQSGIAADGSPEISFCVRTVQYMEQIARVISLYALNELYNDSYRQRRATLLDNYLEYLKGIMNADRDAADSPQKFRQFCSAEFYMLVNVLGFFGNDCPQAALAKHTTDFGGFFWRGDFLPDRVMQGKSAEERAQLIGNYVQSTHLLEWWGIWRSAALHEFGHLVSCHHGSFAFLSCSKAVFATSLHDEKREIQADGYVLERAAVLANNDTAKFTATVWTLIVHNLSRAVWSAGHDLRLDRMVAHQKKYKTIYRRLLADTEFSKNIQRQDPAIWSALQKVVR